MNTLEKFVMKAPLGFTINIGWNSWGFPQIVVTKQRLGGVRPRIYNDKGELENVKLAGLKLDLGIGTWRRPIPKFWKKDFWCPDYRIKSKYNPWNSGNHWFILTIPAFPYFFICAILGRFGNNYPGFYLGGRSAYVNNWTHWMIDYSTISEKGDFPNGNIPWIRNEQGIPQLAWGEWWEEGNCYIEPTLSIRKDMLYS